MHPESSPFTNFKSLRVAISLCVCEFVTQMGIGTEENGKSPTILTSSGNVLSDQPLHVGLSGDSGNFRRRSEIVAGSAFDTTEWTISREMENKKKKEKIRKEIITAGAAKLLRRRELEDEVIREMLMGGEIGMRREGGGPSLADSLLRPEVHGAPLLGRPDGFMIEERPPAGLSGQKSGGDGRLSSADRFDQRQAPEEAVNEIAVESVKELNKEQMVSSDKLTNSSVGIKRKSEAPPTECEEGTFFVNFNKQSQKKWSCALCQVSTTSELNLKIHLEGKKHKAKEKVNLITTKTIDNKADNLKILAQETENPNDLVATTGHKLPNLHGNPDGNREEMNDLEPADRGERKTELKKTDGSGAEATEKQTAMESSTNFKFWCPSCKFGTNRGERMTAHRMGNQHMTMSRENRGGVIVVNTMPGNKTTVP